MSNSSDSERVAPVRKRLQRVRLPGKRLPDFELPAGFESTRYLGKWLLIGSIIGIVAGLGAALFYEALELATRFFLGGIVGYLPPTPIGEGNTGLESMARPWLLPVVTTIGGLIAGILVYGFAPAAEGHGTDAAIEALTEKNGHVDARVPPVKLLASAITLGSGGSGGREGPTAQISAGFASFLSERLRLSPADRRIAGSAGVGAGIGAIFRAPLGGAVMASEILYLHDMEVEVLIPALITSIVAFSVFGSIIGFDPIFGQQTDLGFTDPTMLFSYALLGVAAGLVGLLYATSFHRTSGFFDRLGVPRWSKPAIGGLLVGLMGMQLPGVLGTGYGWVQIVMSDQILRLPFWVVIALPFGKILATSFTVGSKGPGGLFGPGMVIGGTLGAAFWRIGYEVLPNFSDNPAPFVIVAMMALYGGIAHAPFGVMLMVAEMTGNLSLLAPAMIAVAISTLIVGDRTIYRAQLPNRAAAPAHKLRSSFPLLATLSVRNAYAPITDAMRGSLAYQPAVSIGDALDDAVFVMVESEVSEVAVVDGDIIVGRLTWRDVFSTYRSMIDAGLPHVEHLPTTAILMEFTVGQGAPVDGQMLAAAGFPARTLVVTVTSGNRNIIPTADTVLSVGERVTVLGRAEQTNRLRSLIEGTPTPGVD